MTTKELREKRASVHGQMKAVAEKAKSENRSMNEDENRQWDAWDKEFEGFTKQIETTQKLEEREALLATEQGEKHTPEKEERTSKETKEKQAEARTAAFGNYLRFGYAGLEDAEKRTLSGMFKEEKEMRAQTKGTASAGGYAVPTTLMNEIAIARALWGGVRQAARGIKTSSGETINWPSVNDTGNSAQLVAELGDVSAAMTDLVFGSVAISSYKLGDMIQVSRELLEDSEFDLESLIAELIGERVGRKENSYFTTGTGTGQPQGVVTGATNGKTAASATVFTRAELIDLVHSVNPAYRVKRPKGSMVGFMFNDTTLAQIKKLAIGTGDDRPLWQPSMRDGAPDTIDGFPYIINQDMANVATAAKPILFGDFSNYIVRDSGSMLIRRLDERYAELDKVAFLVFERVDGKLVNPGNNPIKYMTMA
jgi:HK97 family phage major capsid protein